MSRQIKAILIDPYTQTVQEVEIEASYEAYYSVIGNGCALVDRTYLDVLCGECLYFDDEGNFNENTAAFVLKGCVPVMGRGLIVGTGGASDCDTSLTVEAVKRKIDHFSIMMPVKNVEGVENAA